MNTSAHEREERKRGACWPLCFPFLIYKKIRRKEEGKGNSGEIPDDKNKIACSRIYIRILILVIDGSLSIVSSFLWDGNT